MTHQALIPDAMQPRYETLQFSPGIWSGDHVFLTGMTGSDQDGLMPSDLDQQFRNAFDKIAAVLAQADLTFANVVEMTSYHIGLRDHFDQFDAIRRTYISAPYPAWTAIEVAGLRQQDAVVEIRGIAYCGARD